MFSNTEFYIGVMYLFIIAIIVKLLPTLLWLFRRQALGNFWDSFLLSARFSLIIAMAEIGVEIDLISKSIEQQIIL